MCRRTNERLPVTKVMTPEEIRVAATRALARGMRTVLELPFPGDEDGVTALLSAKIRCRLKQNDLLLAGLRSKKV